MTAPTEERIEELLELVEDHLNIDNYERFQYHSWDGLIECDEEMTVDELEWISENFEVTVTVTRKE